MKIWVDAQLSPRTARWIAAHFSTEAAPLRELNLRDAGDEDIFAAAREANAIVLTKDSDFVRLLEQHGSPPKILWLTCGNTSEAALQQILSQHLSTALGLLESGEDLVEIGSP
jgi:predicted nuclease of predicted toxin-antitoxin system